VPVMGKRELCEKSSRSFWVFLSGLIELLDTSRWKSFGGVRKEYSASPEAHPSTKLSSMLAFPIHRYSHASCAFLLSAFLSPPPFCSFSHVHADSLFTHRCQQGSERGHGD